MWPYVVYNILIKGHFYSEIWFAFLEETILLVPIDVSWIMFS